MFDGLYQSIICFFVTYLLFYVATFESEDGLNVNGSYQMGVYIANPVVIVVNVYILMNTYRWDGIMLGLTAFSILLIWFWTGVWTSTTGSFQFYKAAPQVYGQLTFWAGGLLTIVICLLPRFFLKSFQKIFRPYDIDIVREQVRQGKFDYLNDLDPASLLLPKAPGAIDDKDLNTKSISSSDATGSTPPIKKLSPANLNHKNIQNRLEEDERPIIHPPGTSHTQTTRGPHSTQGSDDTINSMMRGEPGAPVYDNHSRLSDQYDTQFAKNFGPPIKTQPLDRSRHNLDSPSSVYQTPLERPGHMLDRPRPSFDRARSSMDQLRPSFEQSRDMTTAAGLMKVDSRRSGYKAGEVHRGYHEG